MKKVIFTWVLCMVGVIAAEAQLSINNEKNKGNTVNNREFKKRFSKDPHWRFSEYKPKISKKDQRKINKKTRELEARSYSSEKSPYFSKKEARETRAIKKRKERALGGKSNTERKIKLVRKDSQRKYNKTQKIRAREVKKNQKNFGTKASRKNFENRGDILMPKPHFYN